MRISWARVPGRENGKFKSHKTEACLVCPRINKKAGVAGAECGERGVGK
jgi:hypothetical protein